MEVGIGKWNTCVRELLYSRQVIPDWLKGWSWAHNINSSCRFWSSWHVARGKGGGEERRRCQRSSRRSGSLYLCWCFVQFLTRQSLLCWYCSLFSRYYFPWCWYWIFCCLLSWYHSFMVLILLIPISLNANRWCLTFYWFCFPFSCQYYSMYCSQLVEKYFDHINIVLAISTIPK